MIDRRVTLIGAVAEHSFVAVVDRIRTRSIVVPSMDANPARMMGESVRSYFLHSCSYLPLAQVVPPGPCATPIPFLVLALPPLVVWVVVTPFELVWATAALPVLEFTATALFGPRSTLAPFVVLTVLLV